MINIYITTIQKYIHYKKKKIFSLYDFFYKPMKIKQI